MIGALFVGSSPALADVNNFRITNFEVQMNLGRDDEGRSTLKTVEKITAKFPDFDQNHGLERAFVKKYEDHSTSLKVESVTDQAGKKLPYSWYENAIRIGDADKYVHGEQTYVITYTQRDVTRFYEDTASDEFYWDVIGLDWQVPIDRAMVDIKIDDNLKSALTGKKACYWGVDGSRDRCNLEKTDNGYKTTVENLSKKSGVTVAIGFQPGTFQPYVQSLQEKLYEIWVAVNTCSIFVAIIIIAWVMTKYSAVTRRKKDWGTIVPEYIPPKNASVMTASRVAGDCPGSVRTAQLIDLAVRHYIRLYEVKPAKTFSLAEYEIEIIKDIKSLKSEEQQLLTSMFAPRTPKVGERLNLKDLVDNSKYRLAMITDDRKLDELIRGEYGFKAHDDDLKKWMRQVAKVTLVLGIVSLTPALIILAIILILSSIEVFSLTNEGVSLVTYMKGLKEYIGVAEEERLRILQSPTGAEKSERRIDGKDTVQLVKLYERLLPYAIVFGKEKEWSKQMGKYYETIDSQPDWYDGQSAFTAVAFSSMVSDFSSLSTAVSSTSSSSGGSDGGGSSGGGGGGGGGGGW